MSSKKLEEQVRKDIQDEVALIEKSIKDLLSAVKGNQHTPNEFCHTMLKMCKRRMEPNRNTMAMCLILATVVDTAVPKDTNKEDFFNKLELVLPKYLEELHEIGKSTMNPLNLILGLLRVSNTNISVINLSGED